MTDLQTIRENKSKTLTELYKKWPDFKRFLYSIGCTAADAEDVFQEALLIFSRKIDEPDFVLTVEPFHYVKSTCRFIAYNANRKKAKMPKSELHEGFAEEDTDWMLKELRFRKLEEALTKIGKQCQQLLKLFYGKGANMVEIAKKLGMRNDKVAKAQKYRCIHKVKEVLGPETDEDLTFVNLKP